MSIEKTEERGEGQRVRVPLGARRLKLQLSDKEYRAIRDSGYVPRWINDQDGRISEAQNGGYIYVKPEEARSVGTAEIHQGSTDVGGKVSKIVSRGEAHQIRAYLMKIKQEYYDADQLVKEERNQLVDDTLAGGEAGGVDIENKYGPGVTYSK